MANDTFEFNPDDDEIGVRLDKVLAARFEELSRTQLQQLIKGEDVLVNNKSSKPAYKLEPGDSVWIKVPPPAEDYKIIPEDIPLDVLFEDEHIAVINKPAGMVVHPAHGNTEGTLVHALMARYDNLPLLEEDPTRAGIVHRLDKDTSGVLVVALNDASRDDLLSQFKERTIEKHYLALTDGHPPNDKGIIDAPIGRDPRQRKRMAVMRDGRDAVTEFSVRTLYKDHALLDVHPVTGRTHQIRVHLG
ncbi:MAG: RluA family pseudouridine synthase, partial [Chloroflexi bacterium]|nr:RluA family pseudouridine synthase [Chloroflexota bacterium]